MVLQPEVPPAICSGQFNDKGVKMIKTLLLLPFKILWFFVKLPFKILGVLFRGAGSDLANIKITTRGN